MSFSTANHSNSDGFTLVEISIVLVIIGFLVGGIFVGRDLINAAAIRGTISQLEKYQTALRTFRLKYNAMAGDLTPDVALALGFRTRTGASADGNGNGLIDATMTEAFGTEGERRYFWDDLATARLIDGPTSDYGSDPTFCNAAIPAKCFPLAKISRNNYFTVWSGSSLGSDPALAGGRNYYSIVANGMTGSLDPNPINTPSVSGSIPGLSVSEAYRIDQKIDDALPQSGTVVAMYPYVNYKVTWSNRDALNQPVYVTAVSPGDFTCFDNNGVANQPQKYSTAWKGGNYINCALSINF